MLQIIWLRTSASMDNLAYFFHSFALLL
jgi:hypothetical protein